jgi:hypothetical protein
VVAPASDPLPVPLPAHGESSAAEERPGSAGTALAWAGSAPVPLIHADQAMEVAPARVAKRSGGAAKHLGEVIHLLRVVHDAKAALAALDRHSVALAEGSLGHEALILRVEALLALGRQDEVLRLLDRASLADVAASHSLLVTRGKLRAAAHRCADGIGDFDLVLAESRKPERDALAGRALCRKELGDGAGARADLERLRRELPGDPRLPELERRLQIWP